VSLDGEEAGLGVAAAVANEHGDVIDEIALDEALTKLRAAHPRAAEVVTLRRYGTYSREEIAQMLGVSPRTVDLEWRVARGWLFAEMTR